MGPQRQWAVARRGVSQQLPTVLKAATAERRVPRRSAGTGVTISSTCHRSGFADRSFPRRATRRDVPECIKLYSCACSFTMPMDVMDKIKHAERYQLEQYGASRGVCGNEGRMDLMQAKLAKKPLNWAVVRSKATIDKSARAEGVRSWYDRTS